MLPAAAGKPGHRVCFPVTETGNPEIQAFITGLLRTTGQPVIPEPVSPEAFRDLQSDAGDVLHHGSADHSHSEVQTRVLNMFREACRVGASDKSTTGRSFMALWLQHGNGQRRIITQEDPVEGEVEGAIHTSVTADRSSEEDINLAWLRGRRPGCARHDERTTGDFCGRFQGFQKPP